MGEATLPEVPAALGGRTAPQSPPFRIPEGVEGEGRSLAALSVPRAALGGPLFGQRLLWIGSGSISGPLLRLTREENLGSLPQKRRSPAPKWRGGMDEPLTPRASAQFIAENSRDVFIDGEGVRKVADLLLARASGPELRLGGWKALHELNPRAADEAAVNWVFLVDTLNFSFWSERDEHKCLVGYRGTTYSGYWSLCAAVNRALDEGWCLFSRSDPTLQAFEVSICPEGPKERVGRWNNVFRRTWSSSLSVPLLRV